MVAEAVRVKPRFRGISHLFACMLAVIAGVLLVSLAPNANAATAGAVYAGALVTLFGVSALYHVPMWQPRPRRWLRRLDHASIFVLIAGTYTPLCMLALPKDASTQLLWIVWLGAVAGMLQSLFWVHAPRPLTAGLYMLLGWVLLPYIPQIWHETPSTIVLVLGGGAFYTAGGVIYAMRRPDPLPPVFGYHEIFHVLTILATICHFTAVARLVGRAI